MSFHLRSLEYYASQGTEARTRDPSQEQKVGSALRLLTHASLARCPQFSQLRKGFVPPAQVILFDLYVYILIVSSAAVGL